MTEKRVLDLLLKDIAILQSRKQYYPMPDMKRSWLGDRILFAAVPIDGKQATMEVRYSIFPTAVRILKTDWNGNYLVDATVLVDNTMDIDRAANLYDAIAWSDVAMPDDLPEEE